MIGIQDIALFITAGLVLNITPGPDTAYIVGRSAAWLARRCCSGAWHRCGCLVYIVAATVGTLLAASAATFAAENSLGQRISAMSA